MDAVITTEKKNNDLIDLLKFVLSFMIVAIHTGLFGAYLYPWLRLAVPLFFITSAYLFFSKVNSCDGTRQKLMALKSFVLRNLKLYAFWFVVLFPINVFTRAWFSNGFLNGILNIFQNFLVGSTFVASWFISALVIGTAIVFFASMKVNNTTLFIIGAALNILISLRSSYIYFFREMTDVLVGVINYENIMNNPYNSFPVAIFYIVCGKIFADGVRVKVKTSALSLAAFLPLLFVEWYLIYHFADRYNYDCYIMLAPCALAIFNILIQLKPTTVFCAKEMRKASIIVFASHGAILSCLNWMVKKIGWDAPSFIVFLITCIIALSVSLAIIKLEEKKGLGWLKYSH